MKSQYFKRYSLTRDNVLTYEKHLSEQRKYYFAVEAVRRSARDIYDKKDQFDLLKSETYEYIKDDYEDLAENGLARLKAVLRRIRDFNSNRCWLLRDADCIGVPQKKGVCHFLVKDETIEVWVRDDDGPVI